MGHLVSRFTVSFTEKKIVIQRSKFSVAGLIPWNKWVQIGVTVDLTTFGVKAWYNKNIVANGTCGLVDGLCSLFTQTHPVNGFYIFSVKMQIASIYID